MPIALAKLQWKSEYPLRLAQKRVTDTHLVYLAYIIFAVFDFIGIFVIYFAAVETKVRRSRETTSLRTLM